MKIDAVREYGGQVELLDVSNKSRAERVSELAILRHFMHDIVEAPEEKIAEAVRLLFTLANLKAEPTGALNVAAVMYET